MPPRPSFRARQIFNDPNFAGDAFLAGLGNANVSPALDAFQGLQAGIQTGQNLANLIEDVGPYGQKRRQLEIETAEIQKGIMQSQSVSAAIKAKADAVNQDLIVADTEATLNADILDKQNKASVSRLISELSTNLSQVEDPESLTSLLSDPRYIPAISQSDILRNIAVNQMVNKLPSMTPEQQVASVQRIMGVNPNVGNSLVRTLPPEAQQMMGGLLSGRGRARREPDAGRASSLANNAMTILGGKVLPGDAVGYNPDNGEPSIVRNKVEEKPGLDGKLRTRTTQEYIPLTKLVPGSSPEAEMARTALIEAINGNPVQAKYNAASSNKEALDSDNKKLLFDLWIQKNPDASPEEISQVANQINESSEESVNKTLKKQGVTLYKE